MPSIYIDDLTDAINEANQRFDQRQPGSFRLYFEAGEVEILNNIVGTRWDYGAPAIWRADYSVINALTPRWLAEHPNSGAVLPPQEKPHLGWQVNFQFSSQTRLFNFHVSVPEP